MSNNQKKFSLFVFLSTLGRNLVEVFIPIILYKFGFSFKDVILYYLFVNFFSLCLSYPCVYISNKYSNKFLCGIGIVSFIVLQILLNNIFESYIYIIMLSFVYALYRRAYWLSRRFYNLRVIKKKNISSTYSLLSIINQLGIIFGSYIGAVLLDFLNIKTLTIIAVLCFILSLIPLYLLNFEHKEEPSKIELINTFKLMPKNYVYLFGSYELVNILKFLITLYVFLYVKNNYQTIGILNVFTNFATIVFSYLYGKKVNKEQNFLHLSIFLVIIVSIFKINFTSAILVFISFFEGLFYKMYEISVQKEFYSLSKTFEYHNYNLMYDVIQNIFRTVVMAILYFFVTDLKVMIIVVLLFIALGLFVKTKNNDII